ncbi:c-type cytochrome domain-containing protein [Prosthecobacter sp.]|uniref:c-type cytochrome domain-containing protein n=1 Tax=Prosthecobacter sp. TaxID=1965333 RepID=UPI002ABACD44|nr:c-type cytochrome domain-containing protein [Prosthecobacter sp.]MDZ4406192.1 c-type cytochrome domain-containing protein [Prosthecobacter sp.]
MAAAEVSFSKQIAPILIDQCVECHRAGKAKGSYRLDTVELMLKAGDSEAAPVVAGKPDESELFRLIVAHDGDDRMPKKADALSEKQIALIREWIARGAKLDVADKKAALTAVVPEKEATLAPDKYPRPLPVTALALSPDGGTLACSGYFEVTLWDVATGKLKSRLGGMPERVLALAWTVDHQLALAGGVPGRSGEVWIVDPSKPAERKRLVNARDCVLAMVASPDGKLLACGGADNLVRCFELPSGKMKWQIEPHADWIMGLAFSPDSQHIATASRDRTAKRIDATSGEIEATFTGHDCAVLSVAFTADSKETISGDVEGEIRRWDRNGDAKKDSTLRPNGRTEVLAVGFLDAETPLAATGNGSVVSMDAKSRKTKEKIAQHQDRVNVMLVLRHDQTTRLITGCHDGRVLMSEVGKAEPVLQFMASPGW